MFLQLSHPVYAQSFINCCQYAINPTASYQKMEINNSRTTFGKDKTPDYEQLPKMPWSQAHAYLAVCTFCDDSINNVYKTFYSQKQFEFHYRQKHKKENDSSFFRNEKTKSTET